MNNFSQRLANSIREKNSAVLVGLDPRWSMLPLCFTQKGEEASIKDITSAFEHFCRTIIDIVAPLVPAVKPQAAFFEQYGPEGMIVLKKVIDYATSKGLLVILDGKRNDIGSTAAAYAAGLLGSNGQSPWGADALTVSPYLGEDSLKPFIDVATERNAGIFILVKTSNPGGGLFQDRLSEGKPLFHYVAEFVESQNSSTSNSPQYGTVGAVVGATWPDQLRSLRAMMPHTWFLVPGFGSQGGTAQDVAAAFDKNGYGAIVNNSRGILFAHRAKKYADSYGEKRWEEAVEMATREMIADLNQYR